MKKCFILPSLFLVLISSCCLSPNGIESVADEERMSLIERSFRKKFMGAEEIFPAWDFPDELIRPYYSVLISLIKNKTISPNHQSPFLRGATPLMLAVRLNDLDGIDYLLQNGADPNQIDHESRLFLTNKSCGMTALHYAAIMNNSDAYRKLLEAGASENIRNVHGDTASRASKQGVQCIYSGYVFNENFEIVQKR